MDEVIITAEPIQMEALQRKLQPDDHASSATSRSRTEDGPENVKETGAIVSFAGYVRGSGIRAMSLEHYPGMTELSIQACIDRARRRWELHGAVVVHRVGKLLPGELIVWVGVAASHRASAFLACESIMDFLKVEVPLWKREQALNGNWHWVEAKSTDQARASRWADELNEPPAGHVNRKIQ
ncbi:MAG: hypothetical protein Cons2KO_20500 [Congregibacter sp.]